MLGMMACGDDDPADEPYVTISADDGGSADGLSVSADAVEKSFTIASNSAWTIVAQGSSVAWVSVSPAQGEKDGTFKISVQRNTSTTNRSMQFAFVVNEKELKILPVSQAGFGPNIAVTPPAPDPISEDGGSLTFNIATNADAWSYSKPDWLTETAKTATSLTLNAAANDAGQRTGNVVFSLTDYTTVTQTVSVSQTAVAAIVRTITLSAPDNNAAFSAATPVDITFSWTSENITAGYVLMLHNANDMSAPMISLPVNALQQAVSTVQLDDKLAELNVPFGTPVDLFWSVKAQSGEEALESPVATRKISFTRKAAPTADMLDVVFAPDLTATDASAMHHTVVLDNSANVLSYALSATYNRAVVSFNPPQGNGVNYGNANAQSVYRVDYDDNAEFKSKLADGHSFECLIQFDHDYTSKVNYETKFFSSQEGGGTGFMVSNRTENWLTFLPNVALTDGGASNWIWAESNIKPDGVAWYHLVGVWDAAAGKAYLYVDGVKVNEVNAAGFYRPAQLNKTNLCLMIGGDPDNNAPNRCQNPFKGSIAVARIYDAPLTAADAAYLFSKVIKE
jgi:hypothetical protein